MLWAPVKSNLLWRLQGRNMLEYSFYFCWLMSDLNHVISGLFPCQQLGASSLFGPCTVTHEFLPQRSRDRQLIPAAMPRATWQWWQRLQQQQPSWEPVCPTSPAQLLLVAAPACTRWWEAEESTRLLWPDTLRGACGEKCGDLVTSAGTMLHINASYLFHRVEFKRDLVWKTSDLDP